MGSCPPAGSQATATNDPSNSIPVVDSLEIITLRRRNGEITLSLHDLRQPLASRQAPSRKVPQFLAARAGTYLWPNTPALR